VNTARDGAATALQPVADDGRLATITGDPPSPNEESLPPTPTSVPTAHGLPH
jgi:hypothetical protein